MKKKLKIKKKHQRRFSIMKSTSNEKIIFNNNIINEIDFENRNKSSSYNEYYHNKYESLFDINYNKYDFENFLQI